MSFLKSGIALVVLLSLSGCAHITVDKLGSDPVAANGVVYALPKTVVRTQLKVDRTEKKAAPFAVYAPIFAPEGKVVCLNDCGVAFSMQEGATFTTYGEPDPANVFLVKFTNGRTIDQTLAMTWTEAGLLSAASASVTNRSTDIAVSALKLVTGLGAKATGFAAPSANAPTKCSDLAKFFQDSPADSWFFNFLNDDPIARSNYCALEVATRATLPKDETLLAKAVAAHLTHIVPLLEAREKILTTTSSANFMEPAAILPRLETELANREAALFLGSKSVSTWDGALDVRDLLEGSAIPVLKLATDGICFVPSAVRPPDAKALPEKFESPTNCVSAPKIIQMTLSYYPARDSQLFVRLKDAAGTDDKRGFRYRLPAQVKATLEDDVVGAMHATYGGGIFSVAQFGTIISLPAKRTSKTISYDLAFIEATGALKTFKLGTTGGFDAATVDGLAAAGGTVLDARNKARQADEELAQLTREAALLKAKDEICTILTKYNLPCSDPPQ